MDPNDVERRKAARPTHDGRRHERAPSTEVPPGSPIRLVKGALYVAFLLWVLFMRFVYFR